MIFTLNFHLSLQTHSDKGQHEILPLLISLILCPNVFVCSHWKCFYDLSLKNSKTQLVINDVVPIFFKEHRSYKKQKFLLVPCLFFCKLGEQLGILIISHPIHGVTNMKHQHNLSQKIVDTFWRKAMLMQFITINFLFCRFSFKPKFRLIFPIF